MPLLMLPFYLLVTGLAISHTHLWRRASPRAEYLADAVAAKAAGSEAIIEVFDVLLLSKTAGNFLGRFKNRRDTTEIWSETTAYLGSVPDHERKRLHVVSALAGAGIDSAHPPTALRRRLIAERAQVTGIVTVDATGWALIDAELAPTMARVAQEITLL